MREFNWETIKDFCSKIGNDWPVVAHLHFFPASLGTLVNEYHFRCSKHQSSKEAIDELQIGFLDYLNTYHPNLVKDLCNEGECNFKTALTFYKAIDNFGALGLGRILDHICFTYTNSELFFIERFINDYCNPDPAMREKLDSECALMELRTILNKVVQGERLSDHYFSEIVLDEIITHQIGS